VLRGREREAEGDQSEERPGVGDPGELRVRLALDAQPDLEDEEVDGEAGGDEPREGEELDAPASEAGQSTRDRGAALEDDERDAETLADRGEVVSGVDDRDQPAGPADPQAHEGDQDSEVEARESRRGRRSVVHAETFCGRDGDPPRRC
jgi:hypothetical protein